MKIAIRAGHNFEAVGASALINETIEDRKVKDAAIKYLRQAGHTVLDVTPSNCNVNTDLIYGVEKAKGFGADLFISIHFDKAYDSYNGALGHACWIYSNKSSAAPIAAKIVDKVVDGTGFKYRGVRINHSLYELRENICPAIIIETCFCEATEDVAIYKKVGADKIGNLIASAISEKNIAISAPAPHREQEENEIVKRYSENGKCTVNTTLNIRTAPNTSAKIAGHYNNGESVVYDTVVLTKKYVWISWIGGSGHRRYMAIKDRIQNKRWGTCV